MSFASATASEDAEGDEGSSRGAPSFPSTSDGSLHPSSTTNPGQARYPKSLSASPINTGRSIKQERLETFDELLREAGYAHTRVLTPKTERLAKDAATYSARGDHAVDGTQSSGYVTTVASFLAWLGGRSSTTSTALTAGGSEAVQEAVPSVHRETTEQRPDVGQSQSPTPRNGNRNSATRLQPKLNRNPSSNVASTLHQIIPSSSSNATLTPLNFNTSAPLRPKRPSREGSGTSNGQPGVRHTASSPHLQGSPTLLTPTGVIPPPQISRREGNASVGATQGRRSPLPDTWFGALTKSVLGSESHHVKQKPQNPPLKHTPSFTTKNDSVSSRRQSFRSRPDLVQSGKGASSLPASLRIPERPNGPRRRPSDKLLARTGSTSNRKTRASHTTPVTVLCRSSSVGNPSRNKRKQVPLLAPSGETTPWPWNGDQRSGPPLPKINIHAANNSGVRSLARTGSASSANAFSSYSRGSGYNNPTSRAGSAYTTISRTGTGTSSMASASRLGHEGSVWGEYSHSPTTNGFRHVPHPQQVVGESIDTDDDSENEPRLANILAPHVKSGAPRTEPVERRASIRSLKACLQRHNSVSNGNVPFVTSPTSVVSPSGPRSPNLVVSSPSHQFSAQGDSQSTGMTKRRSTGQFSATNTHRHRRREEREFDEDPFEAHERSARRIEGAGKDGYVEEGERGRQGTRSLLRLGMGGMRWGSNSNGRSGSLSQSVNGGGGSRVANDRRGKMTEREMERERLLWGTNWGRREMDREG